MFALLVLLIHYLSYASTAAEGKPCYVKSGGRVPCSNLSSDNHVLLSYATEETERFSQFTQENADYGLTELPGNMCENWNADLLISVDKFMKHINIFFKVFDRYESCFRSYVASLFFLWSDNCDPYKADQISSFQLLSSKSKSISYKENGHYCVIVTPNSDKPEENFARNSQVIAIWDKVAVKPKLSEDAPVQDYRNLVIAASTVFCFSFLFTLGVLYCKYNFNAKAACETKPTQLLPTAEKNVQIYVIYSHCKQNLAKVALLKDYLQKCAKYDVTLDDDVIDEILVNPNDWLREMLSYKCSKIDACNSSKKFIIVESEKVGCCMDSKNSECDTVEENWYHNAVNAFSVDWARCLKDYCHLFVVNFDDLRHPSENLRHIAHRVRYTIPDHLIDLCLNLENSEAGNSDVRQKELEQCLKYHPIKDLQKL